MCSGNGNEIWYARWVLRATLSMNLNKRFYESVEIAMIKYPDFYRYDVFISRNTGIPSCSVTNVFMKDSIPSCNLDRPCRQYVGEPFPVLIESLLGTPSPRYDHA